MPQKVIKFGGINRYVNEFQNTGACEELINLRPENGGGYGIVRQKKPIYENVEYDIFYEHKYGDINNQIAVTNGVVEWVGNGNITGDFAGKKVSISSAGNILVIYCIEENSQKVYRFKDDEYQSYDLNIPPITSVSFDYEESPFRAESFAMPEDDSIAACDAALQSAASVFYTENPNGLCGAAVVGCTYEMDDGSELWSTAFAVANATQYSRHSQPFVRKDEDGIEKIGVSGSGHVRFLVSVNWRSSTNVKKINVYASRPVFQYRVIDTTKVISLTIHTKKSPLNELNLDGQVMYYQGSIEPNSGGNIVLNFGPTQAGEKIMDVTSGCVERFGEMFSYNNRFHFFNAKTYHTLQVPTTSNGVQEKEGESLWIAYIKFDKEWMIANGVYSFEQDKPQDFIYPLAGVKQLAFVKAKIDEAGDFDIPYSEMFYVNLKDSSAYNYACAFDVTPSIVSAESFRSSLKPSEVWQGGGYRDIRILLKEETNAINVSAPFNPFVFPVEYSYSFGGRIIDVATSYIPVSSTQVGQYPLTVFTSNGIFAMEQGNGSTLYSNITPLQPHVIDGKATSSPVGTFFISSKSLYLLSGRETANLSFFLDGKRELTLRENSAYQKLCCTGGSILANFSSVLSSEDFEDFVSDVSLVYDQLNNELYISSNKENIPYSYVFNIDNKAYHKVAKKYLAAQNGARYVIEVEGGNKSIVDLHNEVHGEQPILMQSRPMALEVLYTHIQRLVLLVDARLTGNHNLCLSVFGSDNLYDWKCIISSQKSSAVFRQIRTNRAAKSFKDYIVLINGVVSTDTDIYDLLADYTVVNRRLG